MQAHTVPDLAEGPCDVLVVGGGVYGACIAAACASASLRTVLVEREGFGLGTSSASLRILHGGIRYLQNLDLRRIHASLRSRAWFARLQPALVRTLDCSVPTHGSGLRSRAAMSVALRAYRVAAAASMRATAAAGPAGTIRTFGSRRAREFLVPWMGASGSDAVSGMARWPEMVVHDPVGMVAAIVRAACTVGVRAFEHIEVQAITPGAPAVATVRHQATGETALIAARTVILACGPAAPSLVLGGVRHQPAWLLGVNLRWSPVGEPSGIVGVPVRDVERVQDRMLDKGHRDLFVLADGDECLAGTEYGLVPAPSSPQACAQQLAQRLRVALHAALPALVGRMPDAGAVLWGWLPGDPQAAASGRLRLLDNAWVFEHAPGIWQVAGTKYVEAPMVAAEMASAVAARAGIGDDAVRSGTARFWEGLVTSTVSAAATVQPWSG